MKAITIYQPYASLIACGEKRFETRGHKVNYRGRIAIHAGMKRIIPGSGNPDFMQFLEAANKALGFASYEFADPDLPEEFSTFYAGTAGLPHGAVIAIGYLEACFQVGGVYKDSGYATLIGEGSPIDHRRIGSQEMLFGDWTPGRYVWEISGVRPLLEPIPCRGLQGLWNWEPPSGTTL